MKSVDESNNLQKDTLEIVLNEFMEEQKQANKINTDLVSAINQLTGKVNSFNEKLDSFKLAVPGPDFTLLQEILRKVISQVQLMISTQPKNIIRKIQILLFPEQDAKLFYKIVFGRCFMWMTIMLVLSFLYRWMVHHSDTANELKKEELRQNKIVNAWSYLYEQKDKQLHRKMDSALSGSFFSSQISK